MYLYLYNFLQNTQTLVEIKTYFNRKGGGGTNRHKPNINKIYEHTFLVGARDGGECSISKTL